METEERYEIRAKIGQGGVGAVFRAFDSHLNREVAIKRVLAGGGYVNQEEATKAMLQEATSLCSIQHPHIVTVFDAGVDQDGPYVVMELLSGRTIDEMIERGTLTYDDFREVALQTQEALIAAQDLDLVHRDIKPTNIMVTWLPSGRFQVKLVDFGLAKFSPKPSLQTIDHGDAVFGSIHFMAPEQFERTPLDKRTDMYSIGCVYYYTLAGVFPFDAENAPQVMNAHLQNAVTPLSEHRPDLPGWLCDWVMWHLARQMDDRPMDARESLTKFLMSEDPNSQVPGTPEPPKQRKLLIPGAAPAPEQPAAPAAQPETAPQSIAPPVGAMPAVHTQPQPLQAAVPAPVEQIPAAPVAPAPVEPAPAPPEPLAPVQMPAAPVQMPAAPVQMPAAPVQIPAAPVQIPAAPVAAPAPMAVPALQMAVPAAPVLVAAPVQAPLAPAPLVQLGQQTVHLQGAPAPVAAPNPLGAPVQAASAIGGTSATIGGTPVVVIKKGLGRAAKATISSMLAVGLVIAVMIYMDRGDAKERVERLNEMTAPYADIDPSQPLPTQTLSENDVSIVLNELITFGAKDEGVRPTYLTVLWMGEGAQIDKQIAEFSTGESINTDIRLKLFDVLGKRKGESAIPALINYGGRTENAAEGKAAISAAGKMATAENFSELLTVISIAEDKSVKAQAVTILSEVVSSSENREAFAGPIVGSYKSAVDDETRSALLRLLGAAGGEDAAAIVKEAIEGDNTSMQLSAIAALKQWPDGSQFEVLFEFADGQEDDTMRREAFEAMINFLTKTEGLEEEDKEIFWSDVATVAVGQIEQLKVVGAMVNQNGLWAEAVLDYFIQDEDADASDRVIDRSERAKRALGERLRRLNKDDE